MEPLLAEKMKSMEGIALLKGMSEEEQNSLISTLIEQSEDFVNKDVKDTISAFEEAFENTNGAKNDQYKISELA